MIRKIIKIDPELCNGCGLCVDACHEGAIELENGKAKLTRDDYCDGLGDCLPSCPTGAISFEEREAAEYDEAAVRARVVDHENMPAPSGCPGTRVHELRSQTAAPAVSQETPSQLRQWPVQIKLVPQKAPYFDGAHLLVAADCSAYAYSNFHHGFMRNKITIIGCPKLDDGDYAEKITAILRENRIKSVTVARMEVPCCGGIQQAVKTALQQSGKMIPWQVVTFTTDGRIMED